MHTLHALIATSIILLSPVCVLSETCTKDQAMNRMMAIGRAQHERLIAATNSYEDRKNIGDLATEIADVGAVIGEGKYNEACERYNDIAKKWNIDLKKASEGMLTMKDLKKDGGKSRGGKCSQAEASIKMNALLTKLQDMKSNGDDVEAINAEYYKTITTKSDLMSTNPSAFCDEIDGFKSLYSLE